MKKLITSILIAALGLSFVYAQLGDVDNSNDTCVSLNYNLKYRNRDAQTNGEVSDLQDYLQATGYLNSEPSGYFGAATLLAVKKFQTANGLLSSGYVGPVTRAKIKELTCNNYTVTGVKDDNTVITNPNLNMITVIYYVANYDTKSCTRNTFIGNTGPKVSNGQFVYASNEYKTLELCSASLQNNNTNSSVFRLQDIGNGKPLISGQSYKLCWDKPSQYQNVTLFFGFMPEGFVDGQYGYAGLGQALMSDNCANVTIPADTRAGRYFMKANSSGATLPVLYDSRTNVFDVVKSSNNDEANKKAGSATIWSAPTSLVENQNVTYKIRGLDTKGNIANADNGLHVQWRLEAMDRNGTWVTVNSNGKYLSDNAVYNSNSRTWDISFLMPTAQDYRLAYSFYCSQINKCLEKQIDNYLYIGQSSISSQQGSSAPRINRATIVNVGEAKITFEGENLGDVVQVNYQVGDGKDAYLNNVYNANITSAQFNLDLYLSNTSPSQLYARVKNSRGVWSNFVSVQNLNPKFASGSTLQENASNELNAKQFSFNYDIVNYNNDMIVEVVPEITCYTQYPNCANEYLFDISALASESYLGVKGYAPGYNQIKGIAYTITGKDGKIVVKSYPTTSNGLPMSINMIVKLKNKYNDIVYDIRNVTTSYKG